MNLRNILLISVILFPINQVMAERFAPDSRQAFIGSCVSECAKTPLIPEMNQLCEMYCNCSIEGLEDKYTEQQVLEGFTGGTPTSQQFNTDITVIFTRCSEEAMSKFGVK